MERATNSKNRGKISKLFPIMQAHLGKTINLSRIRLMALLLELLVKAQIFFRFPVFSFFLHMRVHL